MVLDLELGESAEHQENYRAKLIVDIKIGLLF